MSGRDPDAPIPADFQCDYAPPGQQACPASICDCFVATHPDSPFELHPEDFLVKTEHGWFRPPPIGWFSFGTHVDQPVQLEFSEETGEDGLPLWERPAPDR